MGGKSVSNWAAAVAIILLLTLAPGIVSADSGNTVAGNTVKWSSVQGDLVVWPHTSNDLGTQTQYANLTWKLPSTNLDVAFKFSIPITGRIYLWRNISHPVTVYDYGSQTVCSTVQDNATLQNITTCRNQTGVTGSHTEQRYYYDWDDISGALTHTVVDGSHYYWLNNVAFIQGETKQVKWQYTVPINSAGKWSLFVKRSYASLESALANDLFVELDPWWNSHWAYKANITITNNNASATLPANYTINVTFDHGSLVSANHSLPSGDDVRAVYNGAIELDRINVTAFNTSTTTIVFRTQADIPAGGNASNYELYYGNPNAGAPPADPNNVYLFYDDFSTYSSCSDSAFLARWVRGYQLGTCSIESGTLHLVSGSGGINLGEGWYTQAVFPQDVIVKSKMRSNPGSNRAVSTNYRYNSSNDTAYYSSPSLFYAFNLNRAYRGDTEVVIGSVSQDVWYGEEARLFGGAWEHFVDGSAVTGEPTLNNHQREGRVALTAWGDATGISNGSFDDVIVRNYLLPEPNTSLGLETSRGFAVIIISPTNTTYMTTYFDLNFTVSGNLSGVNWTGYSLDGGPNVTSGNATFYENNNGSHNITVYANDTVGNLVSDTIYFTLKPLAVFIDLKTNNPSYARGDKVTITANVSNHDNVSHNDFKVNFLVRDPNAVLVHNDTVQVPNINPDTAKDVFTRYTIASNATLGTYTVEGRLFDATNTYDLKGITFQVA